MLEDVSFTVPAGDFLSVLGANGAGKSTLFRCLLGGLEGYTGAISLDGRDVRTSPVGSWRLHRLHPADTPSHLPAIPCWTPPSWTDPALVPVPEPLQGPWSSRL